MYMIKLKQCDAYLKRTPKHQRRRELVPYGVTHLKSAAYKSKCLGTMARFWRELELYWFERARLNGEKRVIMRDHYEILGPTGPVDYSFYAVKDLGS